MSDRTPASERTIHTGICDTCQATFAVWPHWERDTDVPQPTYWEGWMHTCPVCDEGSMNWDWSDPMTATIRTGYRQEELNA